MANDLAQIVAEKMQVLPIEEQQKVVEFVQALGKEKRRSLLEKIQDRVIKLSDETLEKPPVDGAENLDHYLYGSPKNQIKTLNIHTILTHDNHFEQEGFTVLL